ncbi:hypothetical protein [Streptomyces griseoaurantiacus]|uniref:hypothetical protein n=1 Tax=Streptomyces griseoaurantiacus TaxID=68213 RepID=UPI0036BEE297
MQSYDVAEAERQIEDWLRAGLNRAWGEDEKATSVVVKADLQLADGPVAAAVRVRGFAFCDGRRNAATDFIITGGFHRLAFDEAGASMADSLKRALTPSESEG